uniref:Uncharacterized protein n=1 Tax=Mesocestoides corti TaxID=53468 RepID=A0A5K3EFD6_MESCO
MRFEHKETEGQLKVVWYNMPVHLCVATIECPMPNRKKSDTTGQALLINHLPESHIRRRPYKSTTLATPLIIYCSSLVYISV